MARQLQKTFNCINDNLDHDGGDNSLGWFSNWYFEIAILLAENAVGVILWESIWKPNSASYFFLEQFYEEYFPCLLYTSDAADE